MNRIYANETETRTMTTGNIHELVRGQEEYFLRQLDPVVRERNVRLDLRDVERIDAAGIAALISLYADACAAGHQFTIVNASHRVAEILALVGLDRILLSQNAAPCTAADPCFEVTAA
jgi:anti-anti-sigma factor